MELSHKDKGKSRSNSRGRGIECWYCKKTGHMRRDCLQRKKEQSQNKEQGKNNGSQKPDTANLSDGYDSADVLTISSTDNKNQWILDSGCSFHMTPRKDWLLVSRKLMPARFLWAIICLVKSKVLVLLRSECIMGLLRLSKM